MFVDGSEEDFTAVACCMKQLGPSCSVPFKIKCASFQFIDETGELQNRESVSKSSAINTILISLWSVFEKAEKNCRKPKI